MNIVVVGVGYVGLVSGTCFAEMGHHVICLDINEKWIADLQEGIIPIYEPGLEEMVKRNIHAHRLSFTTNYPDAMSQADVCFIAVNTPMTESTGAADISQVEKAATMIATHMQRYGVVVTKSTVPVGTTLHIATLMQDILQKRQAPFHIDVVSNPEFLKEGNAIQDFMKPDRIIIGVQNAHAATLMKEIYAPFMLNHDRLIVMDIPSAELSKYAANAMLATRISFMNEMALLCEKMGADVNWIRKAIGSDDRIGNKFLYPGVGFGGSCLPKDVKALLYQGSSQNFELSILRSVYEVNQRQKKVMGEKIKKYFANQDGLKGKVIGILGLSFKPDTDDMREASSLVLIEDLLAEGVHLQVFDPIASSKAKICIPFHSSLTWCNNEMEVAKNADALVLMTEWKQFRLLNFSTILSLMRGNVFFDGRNQYVPDEMKQKGFVYFSIGRAAYEQNLSEKKTTTLIFSNERECSIQ
jgi:UDPglucose 6-dehydrogenase